MKSFKIILIAAALIAPTFVFASSEKLAPAFQKEKQNDISYFDLMLKNFISGDKKTSADAVVNELVEVNPKLLKEKLISARIVLGNPVGLTGDKRTRLSILDATYTAKLKELKQNHELEVAQLRSASHYLGFFSDYLNNFYDSIPGDHPIGKNDLKFLNQIDESATN